MEERLLTDAARRFSQAADLLVDACRELEQCGMADEPIEQLLQSLEVVTHQVHRACPPRERLQFENTDLAFPAVWHLAARLANERAEAGGDGERPDNPPSIH